MAKAQVIQNVKFDGETVELQNMTLVLPPLNFKAFRVHNALKKLQLVIDGMKSLESGETVVLSDEVLEAAIELVWLSAQRNYPDIKKEDIEEGLDFDNISKVIPVLITRNNLKMAQSISKNE